MKKLLLMTCLILLSVCAFAGQQPTAKPQLRSQNAQADLTPQQALDKLIQGNKRFVQQNKRERNSLRIAKYTGVHGQFPIAVVLSCIDSRSTPDLIFDQAIGDIFSARVAGNVVSPDILGSIEYATKVAGSKLIVVMGHTSCGAVEAACQGIGFGNVTGIVNKIKPAVMTTEKRLDNKQCDNPKLINAIAKQNVINQMKIILANSPIIDKLYQDKQVDIVGAMHSIKSGKVSFFDINGKIIAI